MLQIDGQPAPTAKIYWSQPSRMFLVVLKDQPTPLLLEPVSRQVKSVPLVKLATRPDGTVSILEGAVMTPAASLATTPEGLATFAVDGRGYQLQEKPPLVGWQTPDSDLRLQQPLHQRADAYKPQAAALADLKKQTAEVKLTVYFGSWCPFCQQKVPMMMRLARELAGSKVKFDFYGLPHGFSNDAQAQRYGVKSVPTGDRVHERQGSRPHQRRRLGGARGDAAQAGRLSWVSARWALLSACQRRDQIDATVSPARAGRLQPPRRAHVRDADLREPLAQPARCVAGDGGALESGAVRPQDRDRRSSAATGWTRTVR